MMAFEIALVVATLLVGLVAGLVFAFAVVVMPGIATLPDRDFLRAFKVADAVIQRGQPLFLLVWVGSAVAVLVALALGVGRLDGVDRLVLIAAGALYLLGAQLPTVVVNVPLNNEVQELELDGIDPEAATRARRRFEGRWNRWNAVRTVVATGVTAAFLVLLLRI